MNYKYKFSVIIPVYNVEKYIEESILSVINQTIGFKNNIQLILVNDGSSDNSEDICLKYKNMYPDNIVYVKQKNSGVSVARNKGIDYAKGKYVNFLDSDDLWKKNTFYNVWKFFELNEQEIDLVGCRIKNFEASNSYHPLDYKFKKGSRIIDIKNEYHYIQLNGPSVFVKNKILADNKFDEKLKYGEDPYWVNKIILQKGKYGIVKNSLYLYRKRKDETSQTSANNKINSIDYYFEPLNRYLLSLYEYVKFNRKECMHYIESLILYELYWREKSPISRKVLDDRMINEYIEIIYSLIKKIDDEVILDANFIDIYFKMYFLSVKNKNFRKKIKFNEDGFIYNNKNYNDKKIFKNIKIKIISYDTKKITIYGFITPLFCNSKYELFVFENNKKCKAKIFKAKNYNVFALDNDLIKKTDIFKLEIPFDKQKSLKIEFFVKYFNKLSKAKFSTVSNYKMSENYYNYILRDNIIISRNSDTLIINKKSIVKLFFEELKTFFSLLSNKHIKTIFKRYYIFLKNAYKKIINSMPLKKIIILESNPDFSNNTKALFDVMIKNNLNEKYKLVWFVKNPNEFNHIKIKNVEFRKFFGVGYKRLDKQTKKYYNKAKIIIDENKYIQKRNKKQIRIHLNHGSPFKNAIQYNLNIGDVNFDICQSKFFIPVESVVRNLNKNKIIPLGFGRNDVLYKKHDCDFLNKYNAKKIILWLPTYKQHESFNGSSIVSKYGLNCINDYDELNNTNEKLKKENIYVLIKFHPAENTTLLKNINLSNIIIITDEELQANNISLYQLFTKVDALITDYSSVYYDFCLTKKNIGLAISDYENYIKEQGDFMYDYKKTFIGNYMYNNSDLLNFIDDVSNEIDRTYKERMKVINKYDDYRDGKASERIYNFIKRYF